MQRFYKVLLIILIIIIAVNLYAFNYQQPLFSEDNEKIVYSIAVGILGIILLYVMDTWSKVGLKK